MNYDTMKKSELIEECIKLRDQVTEQKHLSSAVQAKDKEISTLKKEYENQISELKKEHEAKINKLVTDHETNLQNTLENKAKKYRDENAQKERDLEKMQQEYEKHIKVLEGLLNRRVNELNKVVFQYGALLKVTQGVLDTHLELNDMFVKEIQGGNNNG